jgi:predicted nucleic acid-binding protein
VGPPVREPVDQPLRPATFDAGALIAIERGDAEVRALVRVLASGRVPILIPAAAVAEVWRGGAGRQARLAQFLKTGLDAGRLQIGVLDYGVAREVGILLGRVPMSVTDGMVCRSALLSGGGVVTSDPRDIQRVIPPERIKVV